METIAMRDANGTEVEYHNFSEEIERGLAWLDEHAPEWITKVDVETLDINDPYRCVLGQVFAEATGDSRFTSGYSYALYTFWSGKTDAFTPSVALGFTAPATHRGPTLTTQWVHAIKQRRLSDRANLLEEIIKESQPVLDRLAPDDGPVRVTLPDPTKGCCCVDRSQDHGEGRIEYLAEYNPACPEHSDHVYDPRTGTWIHRTDVED